MKFVNITEIKPEVRTEGLNAQLELKRNGERLDIRVSAQEITRVVLSWPVACSGTERVLGDAWERGYGDLEWKVPEASDVLPWYVLIHGDRVTHGYGVMTGCASFASWTLARGRLTLALDLRNGGSATQLDGRELIAASVVCREGKDGESAYGAARALCTMMCAYPRFPKEPVYGINNWYYAYGKSSEEEILRDADLLSGWTEHLPVRPFAVIDDGWQIAHTGSCNGGPWDRSNYRFPDMKALADTLKKKNLRPGIWFRPLLTSECFPDDCYLARNPENTNYDSISQRILDPSHPYVLDQVKKMIQGLRDWGYELIKHDFTTNDIFGRWGFRMGAEMTENGWSFYDRSKTTAEIILNLYRALREGAGEDTLILGCNTVSHLAAGIFEMQRTGDDTSGREWARTLKMGVNTLAFRMPQHRTFYGADADCVGITPLIPWEKNRQWMNLLAESGTPLFLSVDPNALTPERVADIQSALAAFLRRAADGQQEAVPLNWMETRTPDQWEIEGELKTFLW